jgi:hypothetical protein
VVRRVFTQPDETLLFAGHERRSRAVSTVLEQRRWHPFFAGLSRDEFLARVTDLSNRPNRAVPVPASVLQRLAPSGPTLS